MDKKESDIDWTVLKGPLIILCVCLVIASSLIGASYYFNSSLEKEYKRNKSVFQSISRRYLDVDQEEKILRDYYPEFVTLYNKGVIGAEKRLGWIEALRMAGEKTGLPTLNYSINKQEEHVPEYEVNYSGYSLYRSGMELSLGLLHEGDLFKLIDYLNKKANGMYTLSECSFDLKGKEIVFEKGHVNISANCLLLWITLDLPPGEKIEIG